MGSAVSMNVLWAALMGYALGSIPFGLLVTKLGGAGDVRSIGSGSIHPTTPAMTQAIDRELAAFMARRGEGSGRHPVRVGQRSLVALDRLLRIMPVGTLRPRLPPAPGFGYLIALRDALGRKLLPPSGRRLARRMALRIHGSRTRHESRP